MNAEHVSGGTYRRRDVRRDAHLQSEGRRVTGAQRSSRSHRGRWSPAGRSVSADRRVLPPAAVRTRPCARAIAGSRSNLPSASASGTACFGGTMRPVSRSTTISTTPSQFVATTARRIAIASMSTTPNDSAWEGKANRSNAAITAGTSARYPAKHHPVVECQAPAAFSWIAAAYSSSP